MKRFLLLLVLSCTAVLASAFDMTGKVQTPAREVLPYASVFLTDLHVGATTDLDGIYRLRDIPAGHHTMVVSYVGYETQTFDFNLDKDGARDFTLREQAITLSELFVTPNGQSIERFILSQTVSHARPLSRIISQCDITKHSRAEKRGQDISFLFQPYQKVMDPILGMMGYKHLFHYVIYNPNLRAEVFFNATIRKGKLKFDEPRLGDCSPMPTEPQQKGLIKMIRRHAEHIGYDETYQGLTDIKKSLDKMDRKDPQKAAKILRYVGAYEENGRPVHILGYGSTEYHIVDGIWQVRRIATKTAKDKHSRIVEFCELAKDLYLPISHYNESSFGFEDLIKDDLKELKEKDLSILSPKEADKTKEQIQKMVQLLQSDGMFLKSSIAYDYKHLTLFQ